MSIEQLLINSRVAALKCRQRKKQWLANLQSKVEMFSSENDALTAQISQLREEVVNLKTLLLAHKDWDLLEIAMLACCCAVHRHGPFPWLRAKLI